MSSFLEDVLIVEDEKENVNFTDKTEVIKKEITKLKSVINQFMKDKYNDLKLNVKPDEVLLDKSENLVLNLNALQKRIDDQVILKLSSSSKELQILSLELKEYNYGLSLSSQLLEIHRCFESIENSKRNKDKQYTSTAMTLVKLHNLVIEKATDIEQLDIYNAIKNEYYALYEDFIEEIIVLWREKIFWADEKKSSKTDIVSLSIQCDKEELTNIIHALHCVDRLTKRIEFFSTKLLQHFINPIIHCSCTVQSTDKTFSVEILDKKQLPEYKTVLDNLQLIFKFLHTNFNIVIENEECFLAKLSVPLLPKFSHMLNNDCISKIIPTTTSELETFEMTVLEIEEFQNYLARIQFISEEQKFLSKYTDNIDKLYIDKKCEKYLDIARSIMKKDLHDSFRYKPLDVEEFDNSECNIEDCDVTLDRKLSKCSFQLPECQISKSAQEILNLVEEILDETCNSSDKYALRFFYTSRNIFEMYAALVPEIHRAFLEVPRCIPQQVALLHNNCFYLAHYLLTLSQKYKRKIPVLSQEFAMIYTDQILLLRQVGSEYFLGHMKYQRDTIFDILRKSGLSSIGQMPELPKSTESALRQCIRQLELLQNVWIEILPIKVYCRVLGCIVNDMVDDLTTKVISVEDIPADVASELVTLFNMVIKRIPPVFSNPVLIEQHVQKWRKLKELIIILGASLKEIEDRWADGKGPLANEFSSQHVKQLIRALFQNTERRSNLLSKIKDK